MLLRSPREYILKPLFFSNSVNSGRIFTEPRSGEVNIRLRLGEYINNRLHLARKYARIFVRGHYLFREANSFPRAKLEENCELRGTDNVEGQISEHIFKAKLRLLCLLSFKHFSQQAGSGSPSYVNTSNSKTASFNTHFQNFEQTSLQLKEYAWGKSTTFQ